MKLYVVERVREDKHGFEEWTRIVGIFKDKTNAKICIGDEASRPVPCKCRIREVETDLLECGL